MKKTTTFILAMSVSLPVFAAGRDDPLVSKVMIDKLEKRFTDGSDPLLLEADAWAGYDLNKLWLKLDTERVDGGTEEAEVQLLYSRAILPFWDFQAGWRHDIKPKPKRDYLVLAVKGLAPYRFDIDAGLYIGESGQVNARLNTEYEYMLTQKWVLSPEFSMNLYTKDDTERGIGSGLSDTSLGVRLRYEFRREFAPYIGIDWSKQYGNTADLSRMEGANTSDTQWVAGIRVWF